MPAFISFGVINSNTPQQNAGVFIGENNVTGMDANMKQNQGLGSNFGFFCLIGANINVTFDNFELIDGVINDQDLKPGWSMNI